MKKLFSILTVASTLVSIYVITNDKPTTITSYDTTNDVYKTMNNRVLPGG